jgi:hypothetical protein
MTARETQEQGRAKMSMINARKLVAVAMAAAAIGTASLVTADDAQARHGGGIVFHGGGKGFGGFGRHGGFPRHGGWHWKHWKHGNHWKHGKHWKHWTFYGFHAHIYDPCYWRYNRYGVLVKVCPLS